MSLPPEGMDGFRRRRSSPGADCQQQPTGRRRGSEGHLPQRESGLLHRRSVAEKSGSSFIAECACCARSPLPLIAEVHEEVLSMLPVSDIGKQMVAGREVSAAADAMRAKVLVRRGMPPEWPWRKAHAVETAAFRDLTLPGEREDWTPGPSTGSVGNVLERRGDGAEWMWLSRGTDWQAFQGGLRAVSEAGVHPSWVSFQVRVATPQFSGANIAFSSEERRWGLRAPILLFSYRGGDSSNQRGFLLETCSADGHLDGHPCQLFADVSPDQVYEVAIHLDWGSGELNMFVNGQVQVKSASFETRDPIRLAAIYNWRSNAVTAFSELMLGETCPYVLKSSAEVAELALPVSSSRIACRRIRGRLAYPKRVWRCGMSCQQCQNLWWAITFCSVAMTAAVLFISDSWE